MTALGQQRLAIFGVLSLLRQGSHVRFRVEPEYICMSAKSGGCVKTQSRQNQIEWNSAGWYFTGDAMRCDFKKPWQ